MQNAPLNRRLIASVRNLYAVAMSYFLPPSMASDREAANQAQMFLLSHLLGPVLGLSVPLAFFALDPTPEFDLLILMGSILAFWLFPFLMRGGWSYRWLVRLSILNLNVTIFWSCFHYGGVHSPTLVWVLIIPILSVFYIGGDDAQKKELVGIGATCSLVFVAAYLVLQPGQNDIPDAAMEFLSASSAIAVMCYIAIMAVYYARIFDAGVDLEREVARRRLMSIELQRSVETADRAASAKSEFLARMSHELRSPLNAIIGYGELLLEDCGEKYDKVIRRDLGRILDAGGYLTRLIDMILSLAKIDAGKMRVNPRPALLNEILDEVAQNHRDLVGANGSRLEIRVAPEITHVTVDRNHLLQIIDIIVKNAATHTQDGEVWVDARPARIGDEPAFEIAVRDTGCGIPPEVLSVIFETFLIDREAAGGRYGGTGLALSVASKLSAVMGGTLTAESVEGEGSTFCLRLPSTPVIAQCAEGDLPLAEAA